MIRTENVNCRQWFLVLIAVVIAVSRLEAVDPIFDDDEEIAATKAIADPADAMRPANAPAIVPTQETQENAKSLADKSQSPPKAESTKMTDGAFATSSQPADALTVANVNPAPGANNPDIPNEETAKPVMVDVKASAVANGNSSDKRSEEAKPADPVTLEPEKAGIAAATIGQKEKAKEYFGQRHEGDVGRNDELGYQQSKVTAQMLELEERMYRLSDALKSLEPENASRLLIGLKYAREELIQLQMKEIQSALSSKKLRDAIVEQKQVLAKLQRLEQLLLSPDLDFQLQLERLRLMRELIKRLDAAIKEEEREKAASEQAAAKEKQLEGLRKRKATIQEVVARQTTHVKVGEDLTSTIDGNRKDGDVDRPVIEEKLRPAAIEVQALDQQKTREMTADLEKSAESIVDAGKEMDRAMEELKKSDVISALPRQAEALELLKRALQEHESDEQKLEAALAEEKFLSMRKEQANTRKSTEGISEAAVQLGDSGAAARSELIRAGGSMSNAETGLGGRNASDADIAQGEALASLKYARELLEAEAEKLLNRLRSEIKKRTIEGIVEMLEGQVVIRETSERLGPKSKDGARAVLTTIVGLAVSEGKLITIGEGLTSLVEETEFGIALPAALRSVTDAMNEVKERLAQADASEEVINAQRLIEEDLQQLLDAMKQLPSQSDAKGEAGATAEGRERQLNRLIAELKMVRMLQVKVSRDTKDVDSKKPGELNDLTASLKRRIEAIHDRQEDVHDVTELISIERGDELEQ